MGRDSQLKSRGFTSACVFILAVGLIVPIARAKGKKPKDKEPEPALGDLNQYSQRVTAMEVLYELDLSADQLQILRDACAGAADPRHRTPASASPKIAEALKNMEEAVLRRDDREQIAKLKDAIADLHDDDAVHLDDEVHQTDPARAKAGEMLRHIKASQLAAYLADHADEVADPVEHLIDTLADIRDPDADDVDVIIQETAAEVSRLVAGLDGAKAKAIADLAAAWLKNGRRLSDQEYAAKRGELETTAQKIVGDLSPIEILGHFLENEVATLLSNPELPHAIDATVAARK